MNVVYTGQKILSLRHDKGWTQKELAERLNVTDKAVSKWERGLNFPDLALLEPLAAQLDTSVGNLLGLQDDGQEQAVREVMDLAGQEKETMLREIVLRGWLSVLFCLVLWCSQIYTSRVLADHQLFGLPQLASGGMCGLSAVLMANGMVSIWKGKRLLNSLRKTTTERKQHISIYDVTDERQSDIRRY